MLWSPGSDWRWEWMWSILYWRWCDFCSPIRRLHVRWHPIQLEGRTGTGSDLFLKVQKTHSFSRNTILFSSTHFQCHGKAWSNPAAFVSEHTSTWKSSSLTTHADLQGGDLEWFYWKHTTPSTLYLYTQGKRPDPNFIRSLGRKGIDWLFDDPLLISLAGWTNSGYQWIPLLIWKWIIWLELFSLE